MLLLGYSSNDVWLAFLTWVKSAKYVSESIIPNYWQHHALCSIIYLMERQLPNESGSPLASFLLRVIELGESAIHWWMNNADFSDTEANLRAQARLTQPKNDIPGHLD